MVISPHVITGVLVATTYSRFCSNKLWHPGNLLVVVILSFVSHFVSDAIPHYDYRLSLDWPGLLVPLIDGGLAFTLTWLCIVGLQIDIKGGVFGTLPFFLAGFFAILPDILMRYLGFLEATNKIFGGFAWFHNWIHATAKPGMVIGLLVQAAYVILICLVIRAWR